ncbi:MAG: 50S ribosomal protein L11 methyltransferase [Nitrospirae bacterium]|nr:50S ribosomal protein L11 methyltransferase [Nitrospirota bacterium]
MNWLQLSFTIDTKDLERAEDALTSAGALAVTLMSPGHTERLPPEGRITGLFYSETDIEYTSSFLSSELRIDHLPDLQTEYLEDRDWTRAWVDNFRPMQFGNRIWVCPDGFEFPDPAAVNISIDPGQAFGTGTHPTTALCLEWIDGTNLQGLEVVDYGCGSGILSIAAAKVGAGHVWATDNDPDAIRVADENTRKNCVASLVTILPPEALNKRGVDIIIANILLKPLISLAPEFADLIVPGGKVVLSGLLEEQIDDIVKVYSRWFDMGPPVIRNNWALLEGIRASSS